MSVPISTTTRERLHLLFSDQDAPAAEQLLESPCAENLPLIHNPTPEGLERIRFAALKISDGNLEKLVDAVKLTQTDWRDALVQAGFGYDVDAHRDWWPARA